MTYITTITSKGQMTLPAAFRKKLGVRPGERLTLDIRGDSVIVKKDNWRQELEELHAQVAKHMQKHHNKPMTDLQLDNAINLAAEQAATERYKQSLPQ